MTTGWAGGRWARKVAVACGLLVAGMGAFALLGWILSIPAWPSLWSETIPMAPSAALLFVVMGAAVTVRAGFSQGERLEKWAIPVGLLVTLVGLGLAVTSSMGIFLEAERLGITILWTPEESPVGHMSPLTAILFVAAGVSFGTSLHWPVARRRLARASWWLASLTLTVGLVLILAYLFGVEQLALIPRLPPAGLTSASFFVLGIGLLALAGSVERGTGEGSSGSETSFGVYLMIFALLALGVVTVGYLSYRNYEDRYREGIESQLLAVWQLKVDELEDWRAERLGDAQVLYGNSAFSALVEQVLEAPEDDGSRHQLADWLAKYPEAFKYDRVFLLDARGSERLSVPETGEPLAPHVIQDAAAAMRSGGIAFLDFHKEESSGRIYLALLVPILPAQGGNRPVGTLILRIDPQTYLYPFLRQWPTPSQTAETLLVRREGEEVVFLNELRFRRGTALNLRFPLAQADLPAAAAARGETGFMDGRDYRGVPTIAYIGSVPETPWALVARIDRGEVTAPMRARLRGTVGVVVAMLFGALAGIGLVWRQQRVQHYQARFEAERERAWLQDVIARSLNEIYVFDPVSLKFVFANTGACQNIGYSMEELIQLTPLDIKPAYTPAEFEAMLLALRSGEQGLLVFETVHRRKDGSGYPVEVHLQLVRSGARSYFLAIIADITQRKGAETALLRANRMYALISQVNQMIVRTTDADELLRDVCRIAVEFGGFRMAWIGMVDEGGQRIRPVAQAGFEDGYLAAIQQILVLDVSTGRGQTSAAVREGKTTHIHDIASDPRVRAWRDEALRRGYRSSIALPIRVRGEVVGAFSLYAAEAFFFSDEENRLLEEVCADIAFALESIDAARQQAEAESALAAAHARLRRFVDANIIGVVIARTSGEVLEANDYYLRMIGYTREEFEQGLVDWRAVTPAEWLPADEYAIEELRQRGVCTPYEKEYLRRDGSRVSVFLSDAMLPGPDEAIAAFALDITERKRADEALRYHQGLMREMGRVAKVGGWEFDPVTGKGTWTDEVARIHELDPEGETNMALGLSFYQDESRARIEQAIREAIELGRPYDLELELTLPSGAHKWVQTIGAPVLVEGRVVNVRGSFQDITERKGAEEAFRKSEGLYRSLFENMLNGFAYCQMIFDRGQAQDFIYLSVNSSFEALTGLKDVVGKRVSEVIPGIRESDPGLLQSYGRVAQSGTPERFETYVEALGMWFSISVYSPGEGYFVAVFDVITERKNAEAALRDTSQQLAHMLANSPTVVYALQVEGGQAKAVWISDNIATLLGFRPEEGLSPEWWPNQVYPDDRPQALQSLEHLLDDSYQQEYRLLRKDGRLVWLHDEHRLLRDADGRPREIIGAWTDITPRKLAEAELRRHVMYLRALQETTLDLLSQPDLDALFENIVRRAGDLVGTAAGYLDLADPESGRMQPRVAIGALADSLDNPATPGVGVAGVVWQTGAPLIVEDYDSWPQRLPGMSKGKVSSVVGVPLLHGNEVLGVIGLGHERGSGKVFSSADVDVLAQFARLAALAIERAELLAALQTERNSLAARVRERTAELEAANRELEAFAYSVSHDLRGPLRSMEGFSSALLGGYRDQLDDQGKHYLTRIQDASQHMGRLINDMLDLSRITRAEFSSHDVDLSRVAGELAAEIRGREPKRNVEIKIADGMTASGDARLLRIALENLLENAWKFTGAQSKAAIEVGWMTPAEFESSGGDWASHIGLPQRPQPSTPVYFVRDNGVGFDMTYADKLFAPFQRLHSTREFPGTGIGLAIVQRVIARHGGKVWAYARVDQGATFCFTLGGAA